MLSIESTSTVGTDNRPLLTSRRANGNSRASPSTASRKSRDTALFGDMRLIAEEHAPEIAFLPIGYHYTMGPDAAARACKLLLVRQVVPMHYDTFPILTGTPERLKELVEPSVDVLVLKPGETGQ